MLSSGRFRNVLKIHKLCNSASHILGTQLWLGSVPDELSDPIQKDFYNTMII
jgi:hypothetical protein